LTIYKDKIRPLSITPWVTVNIFASTIAQDWAKFLEIKREKNRYIETRIFMKRIPFFITVY
ncbi:MAG: hypothetical protein ACE5QV_08015, partial [Fidelibacterota bacterium]